MINKNNSFINLIPKQIKDDIVIDALYAAYDYHYTENFTFRGESHKPWEILNVVAGEVTIEVENESYILKQGQMFLHKPYQFHTVKANNVVCHTQIISFDSDSPKLMLIANEVLSVNKKQQDIMNSLIQEAIPFLSGNNSVPMAMSTEKGLFANGQLTRILLIQLLIDLIRTKITPNPILQNKNLERTEDNLTQLIKNYLYENEYNKLNLEEISNYAGYSIPRLCSIFKKFTGISIMKYFTLIKINRAKRMLTENKWSIQEISERLNYDSVQHFSSQFKKIVNLTPSQYKIIENSKNQ